MLVRVQPGQPISILHLGSRSSTTERGGSNTGDEGVNPSASTSLPYQGVLSAADGPAWNREATGAIPATLTISDGWQSSNAPVSKTE